MPTRPAPSAYEADAIRARAAAASERRRPSLAYGIDGTTRFDGTNDLGDRALRLLTSTHVLDGEPMLRHASTRPASRRTDVSAPSSTTRVTPGPSSAGRVDAVTQNGCTR